MLTQTELKVLEALDRPMTSKELAEKLGYKTDTVGSFIRKLVELGCVEHDGYSGRFRIFRATGKKPTTSTAMGFTVFGVRI